MPLHAGAPQSAASVLLGPWERVLGRHRVLAGRVGERLLLHAAVWDWDAGSGDTDLFVHDAASARGATLLGRFGPQTLGGPRRVVDGPALEASACEVAALLFEAASEEALALGTRAHLKLPTLGAASHLRSWRGDLVGPVAYAAFWRGVILALSRGVFRGLECVEACDRAGAAGVLGQTPSRLFGSTRFVANLEGRGISDFTHVAPPLLPTIVVPGSAFQVAGGSAAFFSNLETHLEAEYQLSALFSRAKNPALESLCRAEVAGHACQIVKARQPSIVRPNWWPPQAVRAALGLEARAQPREQRE